MTVKVGDWVVSLISERNIVKWNKYKVERLLRSGHISVIDDSGDERCLVKGEYKTITKPETSTNYNDGKWHGWNGGECPVHPETVVKGFMSYPCHFTGQAGFMDWSHIKQFRVIKEHREPREWWLIRLENGALVAGVTEVNGAIKVREVIE